VAALDLRQGLRDRIEMAKRQRTLGTDERTLECGRRRLANACQRALEADETMDQRVVTGMCGVRVSPAEQPIQPMLGLVQRRRDIETELPQPRGAESRPGVPPPR
jgi:hypothetical protein